MIGKENILKNPKPIYVKWNDHFSFKDGWGNKADFEGSDESYECETYGWLVSESKEMLVVSLNYCNNNQTCADSVGILKSCIVKRKFLPRVK